MGRVTMGRHSYGKIKVIGQRCHVYVGRFTSIADDVKVITLGHDPKNVSTFPFNKFKGWDRALNSTTHPKVYGDVQIGHDVWIGYGSTIMGGVKILDGAIVAAGSVVIKDVSAYSIVGGVPAQHIKWRFPIEDIQTLLKIKWWDWEDDKIRTNADILCSHNIDYFLTTHGGK